MKKSVFSLFVCMICSLPSALRAVELPAIISNHMVLEKSARVPIWGKGDPGEQVTVSMNGLSAKASAGADGKWSTTLDLKESAPGPFEMTIQGKEKRVVAEVLVGEVWGAIAPTAHSKVSPFAVQTKSGSGPMLKLRGTPWW